MTSPESRRGARLLAYAHLTVDFHQGAMAALVPFLVLERGYTHAAAAGVVLAFSLSSSVVQPLFGALGDRWRMPWLIPVSVAVAGAGLAAVAVSEALWPTAVAAAVSGVGVAAFHPAGAGRARELSGDDHVVMSWFSLGGNLGFAFAPLVVAATVGLLGLRAGPLLAIPAITGLVAVALIGRGHAPASAGPRVARARAGRDDWRSFARMSVAIACRSVVFVGTGSFLVLFMHQHRGAGTTVAAAALVVFYLGGAFGTAIGGYLARRWPRTTILRWAYLVAGPVVAGMLLVPGPAAFVLVALASLVLYVPFSLHVSLGQDYLPRHVGTASGVTLGLAVSAGGLATPGIGALADSVGLAHALLPLAALPALAFVVLLGLTDPLAASGGRGGARRPGGEQLEPFGGRGAGLGGVDEEHEARLGGDGQLLVGEGELADERMAEPLGAGAVGADVVAGPEAAEGLAAGGELADEVLQPAVVRVAAGLGPHDAHTHLGEQLPVRVEVAGGGVEELEAREVGRASPVADDR
ncbi:MFS transporter, FSR family, fosmidomycin resistance protein [Jiangella alba]|uniref:MFS transporter, FSR family, fosmidomycin resistance protein n=1 Tax=Jiangella alba TaxID=561176 RepID=A0A1H5MKG3_9ACTN|nr:MFS transporter, FSR family, fosmidomycin resistance protein [Jiangella alba]